jgi:hypothetical protein
MSVPKLKPEGAEMRHGAEVVPTDVKAFELTPEMVEGMMSSFTALQLRAM